MTQEFKIPGGSSGEGIGNFGKGIGKAADESQKQKRGDRRIKE